MKSTVFVRPNLKFFLVGAILLLVVQHVITKGQSQGSALPVNAREITDQELQALVRLGLEKPSAQILMRLSNCYERRGDYKRALQYLRRAERAGLNDDGAE